MGTESSPGPKKHQPFGISNPEICRNLLSFGLPRHFWRHSDDVDRHAAEAWIRAHVEPVGPIETAHERPWSTVLQVPIAAGIAWFKACAPVQAFEPRLSAGLFARWPDRVAEVLA